MPVIAQVTGDIMEKGIKGNRHESNNYENTSRITTIDSARLL